MFIIASIIGIRVTQSEVESSFEKYEKNVSKLFNFLDYYWNYYSYDILDKLIEKLAAKEICFEPVKKEMEAYREDMKKFREATSMEQMLLDQQEHFSLMEYGDSGPNIPEGVLLFCASEIREFVDFKVIQQELEKHGVPESVYQMPAEEGSRPSFETTCEMLQRVGGVEGGTGAFYRSLRDTQDSVQDHKFVADKLENRGIT